MGRQSMIRFQTVFSTDTRRDIAGPVCTWYHYVEHSGSWFVEGERMKIGPLRA
jgi:hypothetical protein